MRPSAIGLLAFATLAVSSAAIFIVLSGFDAASIALWRLGGTVAAFAPFAAGRLGPSIQALDARERGLLVAAGVGYGLHFVWWPMGFERTSYESTVVLLATQPVLACVLGLVWLGEAVTRRMWIAIAAAALGLGLLVGRDYAFRPEHLAGDGIVLASVLAMVVTVLAGRTLRQRLDFPVYALALASIALAVVVPVVALGAAAPLSTARGPEGWLALALLIAIPTLLGHAGFHYLVKEVPVFYLNLVIVAEPVIAIALKYALRARFDAFRDTALGPWQLAGAAVLLAGVAFGLTERPPGAVARVVRARTL